LIAHSLGSLSLDSVANQLTRLEVRAATATTVVNSQDALTAAVSAAGPIEIRVPGSLLLESVETPATARLTAAGSIAAVNGFDANVTADEIDLISGIDLVGNATLSTPSLIGTAAVPILVAPTTRVSATSSDSNGSIHLRSLNNSVVGRLPVGLIDAGDGTVGLTARTIDDATVDDLVDLIGQQIELSATAGIGETNTLTVTGATNIAASSASGSIRLDLLADREMTLQAETGGRNQSEILLRHFGTDQLFLERIANDNGDVTVTSDQATIVVPDRAGAIEVDAGGVVRLRNEMGPSDIVVQGEVISNAGAVELDAAENIVVESTGAIESVDGELSFSAGQRVPTGLGMIDLQDGSVLNAGRGTAALTARGDVFVSSIVSESAMDAITIVSQEGRIQDSGDLGPDLVADRGSVRLESELGIGDGDALETQIERLTALVHGTGGIELAESTEIELVDVSTTDGRIDIAASGRLRATSVRSSNASGLDGIDDRDVTLATLDATSDLLVHLVVAENGADVALLSGDDVLTLNSSSLLVSDDLSVVARNQNPDDAIAVRLQTTIEQLELTVQGTIAGDVRIDETDRIELAASDRQDDTEVVSLGNGQLFVNAGESIVVRDTGNADDGESLRDDVEISARGLRGRIELTAGQSIE
ncbi:MAG: hypothetical protein AAFU85_33800, partial [Planctomycetota bacterium]